MAILIPNADWNRDLPTILFVCTGNSCRSQMAEGWAKFYFRFSANIYSAGAFASHVNPFAIQVMREHGIDISTQTSNSLSEVDFELIDLVVTLCPNGDAHCPPLPPQTRKLQAFIADPFNFSGMPDEALGVYRESCSEIEKIVLSIPDWFTPEL